MKLKALLEWNETDDQVIEKVEKEIEDLEKEQKSIAKDIAINRKKSNGSDFKETELQADLKQNKSSISKLKNKLRKYRAMKREKI